MFDAKTSSFQKLIVFLLMLLLSLVFLNSHGTSDMEIWLQWAENADNLGVVAGFEANQADYPPITTAILLDVVRLGQVLELPALTAIKLSIILFLCLTSLVCWLWTKDVGVTLLMHLALLLNSAALAYVDIYFAPALVLALWALKQRKLLLFTLCFSVACLTKWQPLIIAPFILLYILDVKQWSDWKRIDVKNLALSVVLPAAALVGLILLIFGAGPVWEAFRASASHDYLSGNALNANWIYTHFIRLFSPEQFGGLVNKQASYIVTDSTQIQLVPRLIFILFYALTLAVFYRREKSFENTLLFSILGFLAYYTFNIGVHENHLFLVTILAVLLLWVNKAHWPEVLVLILINNINLFTFYGINGEGPGFSRVLLHEVDFALILSVFNVGFFLYLWLKHIVNREPGVRQPEVIR